MTVELADTASADAPRLDARDIWAAERARLERSRYWVGPDGRRPRWPAEVLHAAAGVFALGMRLAGLYARGRRNALSPLLVEFELVFSALPEAFDGYRILHVTDTHLDILPELAAIARGMVAGLDVDLLALTGDVLGDRRSPTHAAAETLAFVLDGVTVRDRRLAVLGNHDTGALAEALETAGFEMLLNKTTMLTRGAAQIAVTGLDDVHAFYTDAARVALSDGGTDFRIALVHSPEMADHAAAAGTMFYLCGHTHGGQICFPGGRALLTRLTRCRHAASGHWQDGAMRGYTSRGLGASWPPLRYNCRGEMTVITLRRAA
jgi:predicted MPP superfamily phosphohydrolase